MTPPPSMPKTRRPRTTRQQQREKVLALMQKPTKRPKYGAVRCEVDGEKFDSKREMRRWLELSAMQCAGAITRLKRQQHFELCAPKTNLRGDVKDMDRIVVVGKYIADFTYDVLGKDTTTFVVEDCKGFRTPVYRAKKRHFERQYGIAILET